MRFLINIFLILIFFFPSISLTNDHGMCLILLVHGSALIRLCQNKEDLEVGKRKLRLLNRKIEDLKVLSHIPMVQKNSWSNPS